MCCSRTDETLWLDMMSTFKVRRTVSSTRKCSVSTAMQVARKPRQNTDVL